MFEQNNVAIAVNVLYTKKEKIYPAYLSKNNSNFAKQFNDSKWRKMLS